MKATTGVVLLNLGSLATFGYLAVHFDRWWIILFVLLVTFSTQNTISK